MDGSLKVLLNEIPLFKDKAVQVTPLGGGITNRNYRVNVGEESFVLRVGGENTDLLGIDRNNEHACSQSAANAGVGPEVVAFLPEHRALITRFVNGKVLTSDDTQQRDVMRRMVIALQAFHNNQQVPGRFSVFEGVREYYQLARDRQVQFPGTIDGALALFAEIEDRLGGDKSEYACHNDLLPANLIDDGASIYIIDWEYAGMGDRFFDLGNLAANHEYDEECEKTLVELYFGEADPNHLNRLRLMRIASDMREAMWGFLQSGISTLDFKYSDYGKQHLDRFIEKCAAYSVSRVTSGI